MVGSDNQWSLKRLLILPLISALLALHVALLIVFFRKEEVIYINAVLPYFVPMAINDVAFMSTLLGLTVYQNIKSNGSTTTLDQSFKDITQVKTEITNGPKPTHADMENK